MIIEKKTKGPVKVSPSLLMSSLTDSPIFSYVYSGRPNNISVVGYPSRTIATIVEYNIRKIKHKNNKQVAVHRGVDHTYAKKVKYSVRRKQEGRWTN